MSMNQRLFALKFAYLDLKMCNFIQGRDTVDRTKIVNTACERTKKGGPDGRALFLRLHFMSQRLHSAYIEDRLRDAIATMPEDDRAILEFVIRELDNSRSVFFFSG